MRKLTPLLFTLLAASWAALGQQPGDSDIRVAVSRSGSAINIHVEMHVDARPSQVWQVLTDYDHMAQFSPGLEKSRAVPLGPNRLRVEQSGAVRFAFFPIPYQSVREVDLDPYREVRSRAVAGTIRSGTAVTRLIERDGGTDIDYTSTSVPAVRLPFGLGMGMVADRTRDQFAHLRAEIYRRMRAPQSAPVTDTGPSR
ncbi:SRPBCC family protein [Noviherbaspirillum pedocola]|uniref:SRPBCC family protein n=1 Tax=Noviherbaspirillum pedocola TaxID=2801341 RepID=A0A934SYN9_9BURK|nr:SRPBCC family protein [Noviherbaspirillum pedocola]MBK4738975.1 SRPBCC family protein [Noviherbaspirillum pedocola]